MENQVARIMWRDEFDGGGQGFMMVIEELMKVLGQIVVFCSFHGQIGRPYHWWQRGVGGGRGLVIMWYLAKFNCDSDASTKLP